MNEIKQKLADLELALNYVCYDAALIPKLSKVWDKLELLKAEVNKNCNTPAVSVVREPKSSGAVCPHFDTCQNGGKNEYCDLQTFKEIDCFVGAD
jgi:hypothetical protein